MDTLNTRMAVADGMVLASAAVAVGAGMPVVFASFVVAGAVAATFGAVQLVSMAHASRRPISLRAAVAQHAPVSRPVRVAA